MLGEGSRLGVFEIGVLRKTFVRLRGRTLHGEWRKLHDEELRDFCCFSGYQVGCNG
jgi:hypothetical protein